MKKLLFGIALFLTFATIGHAQTYGTWQVVLTSGIQPAYNQMFFPSDSTGFISGKPQGSNFDIEVTTDGGSSFNPLSFPSKFRSGTFSNDMSWPTVKNGYVATVIGSLPNDTVYSLWSIDGGSTWLTSTIDSNLPLTRMDFPTPQTGYATGSLADGTGDFIAKSTDYGATWKEIFHTDQYLLSDLSVPTQLYFRDAQHGIFFAQSSGSSDWYVGYTMDGGATVNFKILSTTNPPDFLYWNTDSIWVVGLDAGVFRSNDTGKKWTNVLATDPIAGPSVAGAFYHDTGFVFRTNGKVANMTTDAGATWTQQTLPKFGKDQLLPVMASMPSPYRAYLLGVDTSLSNNVDGLLSIQFQKIDTSQGGGNGVVDERNSSEISFTVSMNGSMASFTMQSAAYPRTIEIQDVLGRPISNMQITPGMGNASFQTQNMAPGTYFARLGSSIVKFAVQ